jgi:hypothetical protein
MGEFMPDWYPLFESAAVLRCPPWELAGFAYENAAEACICWQWWALDYKTETERAGMKRNQAMVAGFGVPG